MSSVIGDAIARIAEGKEYDEIVPPEVVEETQTSEQEEVNTEEVANGTAQEGIQEDEIVAESEVDQPDKEEVSEEYKPNFTYRVRDEEREFDDKLKPFIKSKEDEDYFRDLVTKAEGIEHYKSKITEFETTKTNLEMTNKEMAEAFSNMKRLKDGGRVDELFEVLGISDDAVIDYALKLAEESDLPPEQRQAKETQREYERRLATLDERETQTRMYEEARLAEMRLQEANSRLNTLITSEEGSLIRERMEDHGLNIVEEIRQYGLNQWSTTGKDPSIEDAYSYVVGKYGFLGNIGKQQNKTEELPIIKKKVLPTVSGGSTSEVPVESAIRSFEQLRKLGDTFQN